ncbi:MAG: aminoacyl-tRNA hydrolase [Proteobacteria bacterium]|nr:aminoacyl-tRNA hydrolase [Pseudomonadota bacterium]
MTLMLVGLGNYGEKFEHTRHNVGAILLREIVRQQGGQWSSFKSQGSSGRDSLRRSRLFFDKSRVRDKGKKVIAQISAFSMFSQKVLAVIPCSFMNECGAFVAPVRDYYRVDPKSVVVIHDDLDMQPGTIKSKKGGGGTGGHNGIRSLQHSFGDGDFSRIKIGIGHPSALVSSRGVLQVSDWVVSPLSDEELEHICGALVDQATHRIAQLLS